MSTTVAIPDFGALLAPYIGSVPQDAIPAFLASLERTAAERYRMWADEVPAHSEGLLQCAAREDEIARRAEVIYPAPRKDQQDAISKAIIPARDTYYEVFAKYTPIEQMAIQANAERQGAAAWRAMMDSNNAQALNAELEEIAQIEEVSADYLDGLLERMGFK
ncbi:MAG: hypothetical protein V7742_01190 [Halioglobus sp.]